MITHIQVQRHKSISDVSLEIRPLTLLLGNNGTGKTAFWEGLVANNTWQIDDGQKCSASIGDGKIIVTGHASEQALVDYLRSARVLPHPLCFPERKDYAIYIDNMLANNANSVLVLEHPCVGLHAMHVARVVWCMCFAVNEYSDMTLLVETHSLDVLREVQIAVVEGTLRHSDVILHWFAVDEYSQTHVTSGELDNAGRYGDFPCDFAETLIERQTRYIELASQVMHGRA